MRSTEPTSPPAQWDHVSPGEKVEIMLDGMVVQHGQVDLTSAGGDVVWILVSLGERRLFHKDDGFELIHIEG